MPGSALCSKHVVIYFIFTTVQVHIIVIIFFFMLYMRKVRHREVKLLTQGHSGSGRAEIQIPVVWLQSLGSYTVHVILRHIAALKDK